MASDDRPYRFTCAKCAKEQRARTDRQPKGWKLFRDDGLLCPSCCAASFARLSITLPIREVSDRDGAILTGRDRPVYEVFRESWDMGTRLANWCARELALYDVRPEIGDESLAPYDPKMFPGKTSLYQHWTLNYPNRDLFDGAAGSASDIIAGVENTWKRHKSFGRYACLFKGEARAMVHRWPYPWPIRAQELRDATGGVKHFWMASGHPHAALTIPGGRVVCRLACGSEWRRQVRQFESLITGQARLGQVKIVGRFSGGRLLGADLRIAGDFPCRAPVAGELARVSTGPGALLTAELPGRSEPYCEYDDDLRGLMIAYDRWRERAAIDLKHEKRWPAKTRRRIVQGHRARAKRMAARIKTHRGQVVSRLVAFLQRQRITGIIYADTQVGYLPRLDRTALREAVRCKCHQEGLSFQLATEEADAS